MRNCPCNSGKTLADCCEPFLKGINLPSTPEELMRSRYTAYHQGNIDYIQQTMRSPAADNFDAIEAEKWAKGLKWAGLKVLRSSQDANKGIVEFIAYYLSYGRQHALHEVSEFILDEGRWYYIHGTHPQTAREKIGRNDPCSCGSGIKYKKCCGIAS
jgi:SEC-C motif-containing protein